MPKKANSKANNTKDNVTSVERWGIPHGSARKAKEAESARENGVGAKEREISKEKAEEQFGKLMAKRFKEIGSGTSRRRCLANRRRT